MSGREVFVYGKPGDHTTKLDGHYHHIREVEFRRFNYASGTPTNIEDSIKGLLVLYSILNSDMKMHYRCLFDDDNPGVDVSPA